MNKIKIFHRSRNYHKIVDSRNFEHRDSKDESPGTHTSRLSRPVRQVLGSQNDDGVAGLLQFHLKYPLRRTLTATSIKFTERALFLRISACQPPPVIKV